MNRILAIVAVAAVTAASPALAGIERAGTSAASFLTVGAGPGVLGMGGAALGRSGGLDIAAWNPAALGFMRETRVELAHAMLDDQSALEWASIGGRLGTAGTAWGMSALFQNEGSFEGRDASNLPTESFNVASAAGVLNLAQRLGDHAAIGVAGKYVLDSQGPAEKGTGMTMDAGLSLQIGPVGVGFAAQNAFGGMTYGDTKYEFPASYGGGIAYTHATSGLTAALDVNVPSTSYTNVRTGFEWMWKNAVALRAGYRAEMGASSDDALSGPTFGTGFGTHNAWLDYGFLLSGNAGGQHRLAITLRMPDWKHDPFGQSKMPHSFDDATPTSKTPRSFDDATMVGPPAPKGTAPAKKSDKKK